MGIDFDSHLRKVFRTENDVRVREVIQGIEAIARNAVPSGSSPGAPGTVPLIPEAKQLTIVTVTSTPYSMGNEDVLLVDNDTVGGDVTINLLAIASTFGYPRWIKQLGSSGSVIIVPNGAETIDGQPQLILGARFNSATIITDGTEWWII